MNTKFKKLGLIISCLFLSAVYGVFYLKFSHKPPPIIVAKELQNIPKEDKEALEFLFRELHYAPCSYVLFGDKPMSICSFLDVEVYHPQNYRFYDFMDFSIGAMRRNNLMGLKGWEVWKKYRTSFPSSKYFLLENHDDGCMTLVMINKHAILRIVEENIDLFRNTLGTELTPQTVLDRCVRSQDIFRDVLQYNDELLGILLGYGRHNALLFSRKHQIEGIRDSQKFSLMKKAMVPSQGFDTIDDERNDINKRLTVFDKSILDDFNPLLMALPFFVVDPDHLETKELKNKYKEQYKNIIKQYEKRDFLEVTLQRFCS